MNSRSGRNTKGKATGSKDAILAVYQTDRTSSGRATVAVGKGWHFENRDGIVDNGSSGAGNQNEFNQSKDRQNPARK